MNSDDTVEFKLNIQNIKSKNLVDNFVSKIKDGFVRKGIQKDIDYEIKVVNNNPELFQKKGAMYGGSDSTFPYSVFEQLFDYIDNNVRVIKPEKIRSDKYVKTQDAKKRTLDGLFAKADETQVNPDNTILNNDNKLKNTWDELFAKKGEQTDVVNSSTNRNDEKPNIDLNQKQTIYQTDNQTKTFEYGQNKITNNNNDIDDVRIPDKGATVTTNEESEYTVIVLLNKKYVKMCIHNNMGKRELLKVLE